jgi:hypothetical protein
VPVASTAGGSSVATTSPARIDDELYASAKLAGEVQSRSAAQQVVHWARIGREIEASATIAFKDIAEVLAGSRSYDALTAKQQAVVRAEWSTRMDALREGLDLAAEFAAAGQPWVELDDDGRIVKKGGAVKDRAGRRGAERAAGDGTPPTANRVRARAARSDTARRKSIGEPGPSTKPRKASSTGAKSRAAR